MALRWSWPQTDLKEKRQLGWKWKVVFIQVEVAQIKAARVKTLFVTHLHGDHCFGIPGLLRSISRGREGTPLAQETFQIFGPPGLHLLIASALAYDSTPLCMPVVSIPPSSRLDTKQRTCFLAGRS